MKLVEAMPDWNKMAGGGKFPERKKPQSHKTVQLSISLVMHPEASPQEMQGEVEDLQYRIEQMVEDAMSDGTTLITNIDFSS